MTSQWPVEDYLTAGLPDGEVTGRERLPVDLLPRKGARLSLREGFSAF